VNIGHLTINYLAKDIHACVDAIGLFRETHQFFGALRAAEKGKLREFVRIS